MNRRTAVVILFLAGAFAFAGAWIIAVDGDFLDSGNYAAWQAAGGVLATLAFALERAGR
jgi:hypothetical protein